jgi:hypothetical protein
MNRNKATISSNDQILNAMRTVYQITKLLKMTREQYLDMVEVDVIRHINADLSTQDQMVLLSFARGVRDTYLTVILTEHCEFVYYSDGVKLSVKEVISQGPGVREGCICGHQWAGSEFNFTEFTSEADPWI